MLMSSGYLQVCEHLHPEHESRYWEIAEISLKVMKCFVSDSGTIRDDLDFWVENSKLNEKLYDKMDLREELVSLKTRQ